MLVLVANLGSTSFKYRLFHMDESGEEVVAKGGYERVSDHASVIDDALATLQRDGIINSPDEIDAVGFKTVLGKDLSGCVIADQTVIDALDGFAAVAPAHNPPYANGIRQFTRALPKAKLVALFETAFYQWISTASANYAIPKTWRDIGIRRYGFHGASHKFIAERSAELCQCEDVAQIARRLYLDGPAPISGKPFRVVSCHLGGSSSVTGILNGVAIGTSMGFSPQSGLPQNNRVGELDSGAIPYAMRTLGISLDEAERQLTKESGLLGLSKRPTPAMRTRNSPSTRSPTRSATGSALSSSNSAASMPSSSPPALARTTPTSAPTFARTSNPSASVSIPRKT